MLYGLISKQRKFVVLALCDERQKYRMSSNQKFILRIRTEKLKEFSKYLSSQLLKEYKKIVLFKPECQT